MLVEGLRVKRKKMHTHTAHIHTHMCICTCERCLLVKRENEIDRIYFIISSEEYRRIIFSNICVCGMEWNKNRRDFNRLFFLDMLSIATFLKYTSIKFAKSTESSTEDHF